MYRKNIGVMIALATANDRRPDFVVKWCSLGRILPATSLITLAPNSICNHQELHSSTTRQVHRLCKPDRAVATSDPQQVGRHVIEAGMQCCDIWYLPHIAGHASSVLITTLSMLYRHSWSGWHSWSGCAYLRQGVAKVSRCGRVREEWEDQD